MTPAVTFLKKKKIAFTLHRYEHDPAHPSFGLEAAEKLGIEPDRVFKTLVVQTDAGELVVAVVPVSRQLNLKALGRLLGVKKLGMADGAAVQSATGYILGGVSPLAQKKRLQTVVDEAAVQYRTILFSGGRRGVEIELNPDDLIALSGARTGSISSS
jgi:Cys-tRNA(Pro)/Cys-tRNA(Cys) deacylase